MAQENARHDIAPRKLHPKAIVKVQAAVVTMQNGQQAYSRQHAARAALHRSCDKRSVWVNQVDFGLVCPVFSTPDNH
jgi:hypothetical protein